MKPIVLAAACALIAGAAHAETSEALRAAVYRTSIAARPAAIPLAARSEPERPAGVARTSLDHRFEQGGLDGSLGFLCGLKPSAATDGAAAAHGVDPNGRFVGVKLHMSFR